MRQPMRCCAFSRLCPAAGQVLPSGAWPFFMGGAPPSWASALCLCLQSQAALLLVGGCPAVHAPLRAP